MDFVVWVVAGCAVGWGAFHFLQFNAERGPMLSVVIGGFGGFIGGNIFAPMFGMSAAAGAGASAPSVFIAAATAALLAFAGDQIHKRFGV